MLREIDQITRNMVIIRDEMTLRLSCLSRPCRATYTVDGALFNCSTLLHATRVMGRVTLLGIATMARFLEPS
jgi:hypothetical protein